MAQTLADGTVIPSFLSVKPTGMRGNPGNQTDINFRWGEVVELVYPTDPRNRNGQFIEYSVAVQHKDGDAPGAVVNYLCVSLTNIFGGAADFCRYTLRPTPQGVPAKPGQLGTGSKVTLLCVNGDRLQGLIVGGVRDNAQDQNKDLKAEGHNLEFEFNGLNIAINDAGELAVTFHGKTNIDGSLADSASEDAQGSVLRMTQDGSISFTSADALQSITIDQTNNSIDIVANSELNLTCAGQVSIQSSGVVLGGGSNALPLFSNYRFNETVMNTTLSSLAISIQALATTAGSSLTTAAGLIPPPYVGGALAATPLAAAGAALTAMAPLMAAWGAAIEAFEAQATTFISTKNFND